MPMVLAVTAAAWSGWEWLHGPRERRLITGMLFWVSMAIGFLAKGPIALVPIAMVAIATRRVPGRRPAAVAWIGGALLMLVVIGAWGVPALLGTGGEFARVGLGKHVVARSFSPLEGHGAVGLVGYLATLPMYFVTVFGSLFPWSIWLVPAARFYRNRERLGDRERYLLAGCGIVFAIFTVSRTKLPHYTLPAFPFLALLLASWWSRHRSVVTFARLATLTAMGFAVTALVAFPILAGYFPSDALFARAAPFIPADAQFAAVGYQEPSLVWVFRKKTSGFMTEMKPQQAAAFMSRPGPRFCVIREQDLASAFQGFDPSWLVFRARGYQVAKGRRVTVLLILKLDQVSSTNVTGPSLTSSTSIISPKTPVSM
jgi:4-amino-4-deoxy-L-arabinose transferase-like glycosyltransferase